MKAKKIFSLILATMLLFSGINVFAGTDIPQYNITVLQGDDLVIEYDGNSYTLDAAMEFEAVDTSAEGKEYECYAVDFVLSFDKAITPDDVVLVGNYGDYGWVPLELDRNYAANEEIRVVKTLAPDDIITYKQCLELVRKFKGGYIQSPTSAIEDLGATLKLCMYETARDEDGNLYETGEIVGIGDEHRFVDGEYQVPAYVTRELNGEELNIEINGTEYTLACGMNFTAKDKYIDGNPYNQYSVDFGVSFDKDVKKDDLTLVGSYDAYMNGVWVPIELDRDYKAGEKIRVMQLFAKMTDIDLDASLITYEQVVQLVKSFSCGIIKNPNSTLGDVNAALDLRMYETTTNAAGELVEVEDAEPVIVGEVHDFVIYGIPEYDTKALTGDELNIDINGTDYTLECGIKFTAKDEYIADNPYNKYSVDFGVSFDQDIKKDDLTLVGSYDAYMNGVWVPIELDRDYAAGETIRVMQLFAKMTDIDLDAALITYEQVVQLVKSFSCGIIKNPESALGDVKAALDLRMYETTTNDAGELVEVENAQPIIVGEEKEFTFGMDLTWYADTDAGYYVLEDETKDGLIRFLFHADTDGTVTNYGIKFAKSSNITEKVESNNTLSKAGDAKAFRGDLTGIKDDNTNTYYALGYITVGGVTYWSKPASCKPDFTKQFTATN